MRAAEARVGRGKRSILRRALLTIVLTEMLCMVLLAAVSLWHEQRVQLRAIDVSLGGKADSVFGAVQDAEDAGDTVRVDAREVPLPRGDAFAVFDGQGRLLSASEQAPASLVSQPGAEGRRTERIGGELYRVARQHRLRIIDREETGGVGRQRPVEIVYAMRLDGLWGSVFHGVAFFLGTGLLLILCTTAVMLLMVRWLLEPLRELASAAGAVSAPELRFVAPAGAVRTRELAPLAQALTEMVGGLREAFERQHRFLGDATHELKTSVAVVRSTLELLLLRDRSTPEYEAGVRQAVGDNVRVEELISRMLLLARLEERGEAGNGETARVWEVTRRCVERLAGVAERAEVRLLLPGFEAAALELVVRLGPGDLETLLSNLLVNAIEHSAGGAAVNVGLRRDGDEAVLVVEDAGRGIPEDALVHVFERFYRVDVSRARMTGGAGLGLAIAKALAESGGGTIAVESRVGEGTRVEVRLPMVPARPIGR